MPQKIQIIIEHYYPEEKIIEGTRVDADNKAVRFREKGVTVDEFKKLIRKKFGDGVDIVNKAPKQRSVTYGGSAVPGEGAGKSKDDGVKTRDIIELMKNKYSD
jgi:hypothetical protein